jgi:hypothetical protein
MSTKQKFYISIDTELYNHLTNIAKANQIAVSDLIKLIANINVKTVQLREFCPKTTRVAYYAKQKLLKLNKANVNYKILRFLELYEGNFA